jgi:hypothetical protein
MRGESMCVCVRVISGPEGATALILEAVKEDFEAILLWRIRVG